MQVILVSVGTDGDVFPYVGLGAALRSRGHQVTLVASANYESLAKTYGFAFQTLFSAEENHELFGDPDFWHPLKTIPLMARWGVRFIQRQYDLLSKLITEETVLVASPGILAAAIVHEKSGTPLVSLILQPWMIPSSIVPPVVPGFTFLRWAPRPVWMVFWRALDVVVHILVGRSLNRLRVSLGLKPVTRILQHWLSPQLVLGLFPDWYGQPQADWPPQVRLIGFPLFDGGPGDKLCPQLLEFCRDGQPPIAFTFGTGMAHPASLFRNALEACSRMGARAVFLTKYKDQLSNPLPSTVFYSAFAPFQQLFPQCAAVVHHGGIGTVVKAMAAGIPQLICPMCFDQIDNGVRTKKLGAGDWLKPKPGNGGRQIANALIRLMSPETQSRCQQIAARFERTQALESAAQCIEAVAR
jgi:rhamnosyltransferase subunit B